MASIQQHEERIINRLAATDPQLNTALGTPVRKLIEAVASELATYDDEVVATQTLYNLEAVSGNELDYLVSQFGFTRQEARAARGTVRLYRDNGDSVLAVAHGSQFYKPATTTSPAVMFQTTAYQELGVGVLSADIPVVCTVTGASGNVAADTVTRSAGFSSYVYVNNDTPMTGGRDAETDKELRERFLLTVFRNEASTADQYLGLSLAHVDVRRARLLGQATRYSEVVQAYMEGNQLKAALEPERFAADVKELVDTDYRYWLTVSDTEAQVPRGSYSVSSDGSSVTFFLAQSVQVAGPVVLGGSLQLDHRHVTVTTVTDVVTDAVLTPGTDYTIDSDKGTVTFPPSSSAGIGDSVRVEYTHPPYDTGTFFRVEFDYLSTHNRGTVKSVDLFIDGRDPSRVDDVQYLDFSKVISTRNVSRWQRDDGTSPVVGHLYVPLSFQPMVTDTGSINVGVSTILTEGKHYRPLWDVTNDGASSRGMDAIELLGAIDGDRFRFTNDTNLALADICPMNVPYYHNACVQSVQSLIDQQSVLTSDSWVHEGKRRYFGIYLTLMFSTFPRQSVLDAVEKAVIDFINSLPFGTVLQVSDIETVAANISGVDNVRLAKASDVDGDSDAENYGIWEYQRDGETPIAKSQMHDIWLSDNEIAVPQYVKFYAHSQRTWG